MKLARMQNTAQCGQQQHKQHDSHLIAQSFFKSVSSLNRTFYILLFLIIVVKQKNKDKYKSIYQPVDPGVQGHFN